MLQGASAEWSEVFDDIGILLREVQMILYLDGLKRDTQKLTALEPSSDCT